MNTDTPAPETIAVEVVSQPDHSVRQHAKISPSKLNYLDPEVGGCPGFQSRPGTSAAAEEGTFLHEKLDIAIVDYVNGPMFGVEPFSSYLFTSRIKQKWDDGQDYLLRRCAEFLDSYLMKKPLVFNEIRITVFGEDGKQVTYGHFDILLHFGKSGLLVDYKFGLDPVLPAEVNRQGYAYGVGVMQKWPEIDTLGVAFIQPRLNWVTRSVMKRMDILRYIRTCERIIKEGTEISAAFGPGVEAKLNAGSACQYCARPKECPAYLRKFAALAPRFGAVQMPEKFDVAQIDTPEKAAIAAFWVGFLDDQLGAIKEQCINIARIAGGTIEAKTVDGDVIKYEIARRGFDRVVGNAPLVAEALVQWVAPSQVLGAAKLSIGKLEEIVVPAIRELQPEAERMTKKDATELLSAHLEANGLLSKPDGYTEVLKRVKEKKDPKKISAKNQ